MSRWRAFVDVLDEILNDRGAAPSAAHRTSRVASTPLYSAMSNRTPNRFWSNPARAAQPQVTPSSPQDSTEPSSPTRSRTESRPARLLKPAEESALQTLIRLGAALDRGFTAQELRSTFRALAQRYHPDRHPHASDAERQRLGVTFAELTSAYGTLLETGSK